MSRTRVLDALLGAALSVPIAYNLVLDGSYGWLALALATMAVAVALSRRRPIGSLVIVVVASGFDGNFAFAIPVMSYLVGLRTERVTPVATTFAVILVGGTLLNLSLTSVTASQWFILACTLLFGGVFPWLVGRYRTQHRHLMTAGWELAGQARLRERARIARDMHDSLGHDLSLIALRAGALELAPDLPPAQRRAAAEIRESAAAAVDRFREIIGVLREAGSTTPTEPVDEPVEALVERAEGSGMAVTLHRTGPVESIPARVDRAAYRVVQESLTNAARHAPGAAVTVTLAHTYSSTTVTVVNGFAAATAPAASGGGSGLIGLRERVQLTGGVFDSGPDGDGFRVEARLPHRSPSTVVEEPPQVQLREARRRVRRSLVAAVAVPVMLGLAMSASYYPFQSFDTVLEDDDFDRMPLGTPRAQLTGLPGRQSIERPGTVPADVPPGASCEYYSDGNFPLAQATYRLCFVDGRLVAKNDLRDGR